MTDEGWEARMAVRASARSPGQPAAVEDRTLYTHEQLWALAHRWYDEAEQAPPETAEVLRRCFMELTELLGPLAYAGPAPDGQRGSGEPAWWPPKPGGGTAGVSPTEPYNRADQDVASVTIVGVDSGEWPVAAARRLALSILAAVDAAEGVEAGGTP